MGLLLLYAEALSFNPQAEASRLENNATASVLPSFTAPNNESVLLDAPIEATAPLSIQYVRILLGELTNTAELRLIGNWRLQGQAIDTGNWGIQLSKKRIELSHKKTKKKIVFDSSYLFIPNDTLAYFSYGKHSYRGRLQIIKQSNSLAVLNIVDIEDYLKGVVPGEIGRKLDPVLFDAVRAQAIVARTYALRSLNQYGKEWDLRDDVRDQMYEGRAGEDPLCTRAVLSTKDMVLRDSAGELADTYYHSGSGGHTADVTNIWPTRKARPYLRGIADTTPEGVTWNHARFTVQWTERWPLQELHTIVEQNLAIALGKPIKSGTIDSLRLEGTDQSGRARKLWVIAQNGRYEIPTDRIRWALRRPNAAKGILRSSRIRFLRTDTEYIVEGTGNGHGVGLSQTGAMGRAQAGQSFESILETYYPGTRIHRR